MRKLLGIGFPGRPSRVETLLGEMRVAAPPETVAAVVARGAQDPGAVQGRAAGRAGCAASWCPAEGWPTTAQSRRPGGVPAAAASDRRDRLRRALTALAVPVRRLTRLAELPAAGCCWPASGARLPPTGGQGSTSACRTRSTWSWKLAAEVDGWAPEGLLDSYHTERHAVAADVLDNTRAQMELMSTERGPGQCTRLVSN